MRSTRRFRLPGRRSLVVTGVLAAVWSGVPAGVAAAGLITGARIADGTVTSRDLHDGSGLVGDDVTDHSLTRRDFPGARTGRQGPPGVAGSAGPVGETGSPGFTGTLLVAAPVDVPVAATLPATVACPPGTEVLNGGLDFPFLTVLKIHTSEPIGGGAGWSVLVENVGVSPVTASLHAVCTPIAGP